MTWKCLTNRSDAHLNTYMSYFQHRTVVICHLLLLTLKCWSCPGLRLAQPRVSTAQVYILPSFLHTDRRISSFWNFVILLKYKQTKSKKPLSQITMHHHQKPSVFTKIKRLKKHSVHTKKPAIKKDSIIQTKVQKHQNRGQKRVELQHPSPFALRTTAKTLAYLII